jgi:Family of unknown function (DUF6065)
MFFKSQQPTIQFTCADEDLGVIVEPVPAKRVLPEWFKSIPAVDKSHLTASDNGLTVKRCMPFLDAMTTGWILPLAADVRMEIKDGGTTVNCGWEFDKVLVSNHNPHQVAGNPLAPRPPCKFHNYWTIVTPKGWSCLFVPPLNRPNPVFQVLSGIVDTDTYNTLIHFPFQAIGADGVHVLKKGTPLVQVIPFKRETTMIEAEIRAESEVEKALREKQMRNTQSTDGWYREIARAAR